MCSLLEFQQDSACENPIFFLNMTSKTIEITPLLSSTTPQPVTAFSLNHITEHQQRIDSAISLFKEQTLFNVTWPELKIIVYDLNLKPEPDLVNYVKNHPNLIYRKFNFDKYPKSVSNLMNYSWKILIFIEILKEFGSIFWFDTSIDFSPIVQQDFDFDKFHVTKPPTNSTYFSRNAVRQAIEKHVVGKRSSFIYYTHTSGHGISWGTAREVFDYFPSEMDRLNGVYKLVKGRAEDGSVVEKKDYFDGDEISSKINENKTHSSITKISYETPYNVKMPQACGMIIYNTDQAKKSVLKWVLLCALDTVFAKFRIIM